MIKYNSGSFGFGLLFRLHGSAVFKSFFPALISSFIYILLYQVTGKKFGQCRNKSNVHST